MATKRKKTFKIGDLVRYTAKFRKSIGMYKGGPIDGIVIGHVHGLGPSYPVVAWSDSDVPSQVASANLEKKKQSRPMSPEELINAARLGTGLPLGDGDSDYRVLVRRGPAKWVPGPTADSAAAAVRSGGQMSDRSGKSVVVLDTDGFVIMSLISYEQLAAEERKANHSKGKRKGRKRNTHDPQQSTRNYIAAIDAADRELLAASEALEADHVALSIAHLNKASYWTGQARAERAYASRVTGYAEKRIKELEAGMRNWGKNFETWLKAG